MFNLKDIDHTWTLFLDRDGVINHEKQMDYVYHYSEFVFHDRVRDAMKIFRIILAKLYSSPISEGWAAG